MGFAPDAGVMSAMIITFSIATLLLICRLISRRMTNVSLWWDDYFAVLAWVVAAMYCGFTLYWAIAKGLGHVKKDIPLPAEEVDEYARFGLFMAELLYALSLAFSKLAILGFYWRLFSVSNIRLGIYTLVASTLIWVTIRTFMTIFHCIPVEAYWDLNIKDAVCKVDPGKFMFGTTLVHLLLEIAVLSLPVFQVKNLQLRIGQKIAVVGMFMFGIVPVFLRVVYGSSYGSKANSTDNSSFGIFTGSKGIKLRNTPRTKEIEDDSSQRELAQPEHRTSGNMDFQSYPERAVNHNTVITSCADETPNGNHDTGKNNGIQVKNETNVYYEQI
ncbi:integral membrane protein [Stemphylium lycopersici]|uniref:Integral membrane protein n=1 Tax=Stemphylium lycopersici TaxID=183478 RepID=A0A364MWM2_STELY|nr:hypothetical protein TW65_01027 [Stemphylium lycopersici]RAR00090.1 integral membrane protein [Stemphylium lycopersici]RAR05757.1 integral membrane protein [Stemphylium lycopersici]